MSNPVPMFKPKFAPKVPVKKEKEAVNEISTSSSTVVTTDAVDGAKEEKPKGSKVKKEFDRNRDRSDNRRNSNNNQNAGRGGVGGRGGHWVMPVGAGFFTGNAPAALTVKAKSTTSLQLKSDSVRQSTSSSAGSAPTTNRVARPNELIEDELLPQATTSSSSAMPEYFREDFDDSSDSDATLPDQDDNNGGELENWPPKRYDGLEPLSLPFGPKTPALRRMLASEPILASPTDPAAMVLEERCSLFVVQMPSDLRHDNLIRSYPTVEDLTVTPESSSKLYVGPNGKLGKLRLYKSGKVKLITTDGKSYDMTSGLAPSFMQCILNPQINAASSSSANASALDDESSTVAAAHALASIKTEGLGRSGVTTSSSSSAAAFSQGNGQGKLYFLGNVTKKLVLTPNYELGAERRVHGNPLNGTFQNQSNLEEGEEEYDGSGDAMDVSDI